MFELFIILAIMTGCVIIGLMLMVGTMFMSGKWSLPNSPQRRVQQAENDAKIAKFQADAEEQRYAAARTRANRELMEATSHEELMALADATFQRALTAPKVEKVTGEVV